MTRSSRTGWSWATPVEIRICRSMPAEKKRSLSIILSSKLHDKNCARPFCTNHAPWVRTNHADRAWFVQKGRAQFLCHPRHPLSSCVMPGDTPQKMTVLQKFYLIFVPERRAIISTGRSSPMFFGHIGQIYSYACTESRAGSAVLVAPCVVRVSYT
jgi:hypothetical protein